MAGICLPNGWILDKRVQELMLAKGFELLVRTAEEYVFVELYNLKHSMTEWTIEQHPLCYCRYVDEPLSSPETWKPIYDPDPKTIFGELTKNRLKQLKGYVTYTAYYEIWEIFGMRIPAWFGLINTNQIKMWKWIQNEFGDRFSICWIKEGQKDFDKCIEWAKKNNKEVWLYVEADLTIDKFLKLCGE